MAANEKECEAAGLDYDEVDRIQRNLSKWATKAEKLGITVFGGSGSGSLRFRDGEEKGALIVADLLGWFDGGDGANRRTSDGLLRGEN